MREAVAARHRRRLGLEHFAFMRAVVQGVDERAAWARYLGHEGEASDARLLRSTVAWIRDEFAAAARREDRFGTARLVRTDLSKLAAPSPALPMLEDFAREHDLDDLAHTEQLAAYEDVFGRASQRLKRRGRLIGRQLDALRWLEGLVAQLPLAGDGVAAWLHPGLARHLEAVGIQTLAQLVERINGIGRRWYAGIPALGQVKAERILGWLRAHEAPLAQAGLALGAHVALARRALFTHELRQVVAPASDIRPLEKFIVPAALDGSQGLYRRPQAQCLLKTSRQPPRTAGNDYEALLAWLRTKTGLTLEQKVRLAAGRRQRTTGVENGPGAAGLDWLQSLSNTQRAYRKEAERFLLWAVVHRGKALSSISGEDCVAYRDFLADPQPRARWCGPRARERWSPLWRPFEGPLSSSAQQHAVTILKNLYGFLVDQHYLMGNPWLAVDNPRRAGPKLDAGRSLTLAQWAFVQARLDGLAATSANRRLRFALRLLYATGLRLSEVTAATVDDLRWVEHQVDARADAPLGDWWLAVVDSGRKRREVPVPRDVVDELAGYLASRGLAPDPGHLGNRGAHLLGQASDIARQAPGLAGKRGPHATRNFDGRAGVADSTFHNQLKAFFVGCAEALSLQGDRGGAAQLRRASTHWLRHSYARHAIAGGLPVEVALTHCPSGDTCGNQQLASS